MPGLKIPQEQLPALEKFRTIPLKSLQAFISALQSSPDKIPSVPELSTEDAEQLKDAVTQLYSVRAYFDVDIPEFVSDIADALQEQFHIESTEDFKNRLTALLTIDSISVSVKAQSLKAEYQRTFCTARIVTDVRPVYGSDISSIPSAAMIIHMLRISYHDESTQVREVYIAMDSDDVNALREILDRADVKAKSLEKLLQSAKVRIINS